MDLGRELSALPVAWPATPAFRLEPRRRRRPLLVAALAAAALAAAFAVPQSRGAILRFLHLGNERIEFVATLPPAQERPLTAGLGAAVDEQTARGYLRGALLLPPLAHPPELHYRNGTVSFVVAYRGAQVLVQETGFGGDIAMKKLVGGLTNVEYTAVAGKPAIWLTGAQHVFVFPSVPPRLAGHTLVWATARATYRLEGRSLAEDDAVAFALRMR